MAMDKVIKHGLELSVGWDSKSQNRMRDAVRNVFTEEAHIDFANPENIQGLKVLGEMMRKIFTQAGEKKFDFEKIMGTKDVSQMFTGLKDAAMEFDRVWESLVANMGSFSFKDMFMRDASELSMALQRISDKNGNIIKANIRDIQRAFEEITEKDQNKLFDKLLSAEKSIKGARTWETRTAAALEYVRTYEKIIKLTDGDVSALDVEPKRMKYAERSLNQNNKVAGMYPVETLREAMPQMQTSLQNIFNMAMQKTLIGLTDGGVIDINVSPVVINKLDLGDLFNKKVGSDGIEIPVVPEIDPNFESKLTKLFELSKQKGKGAQEQFAQLQNEIVKDLPVEMQEAAIDRLYGFLETKGTNRAIQGVWKDFVGFGGTGTGAGGFPELERVEGTIEEKRNILEDLQQKVQQSLADQGTNMYRATQEELDKAKQALAEYEKILVKTAGGKALTLGADMSNEDMFKFLGMDAKKAKGVELTRKVMTGGGTGDGSGAGDASSSEIESLRQQLEETNRKREEAELAERVAQDEAAAERHATEAAEEKADIYRRAMDSMQEEIDAMRGQLADAETGAGGGAAVGDNALQQLQRDAEAASKAFEEATNRLHEIYEEERRLEEQIANSGLIDYDEKIQAAEGARENTLGALKKTLSKKADHKGNVAEIQSIIQNMIDQGALSGISKPTDLYFVEQYMNAVADYSKHTNIELNNLLERAVSTIDRKTKETISEYKDAQRRQEEDDPNGLIAKRRKLAEEHTAASKAYNDAADAQKAAYDKLHEAQEQAEVQVQVNDAEIESNKEKIKSYEELTAAVSRYIELAKSLVDAEKNTPEHEQIKKDMDAVDMWGMHGQEDYSNAINEWQRNIVKIKAAMKAGADTYRTDDGYVEQITDNSLAQAEARLRGYIYQYVENFDDIDTLLAGAKTKTLQNIINKEIGKFTADQDIQRQQEEIAEAANAAALAEMEQIEDLIEGSAPTEKFNKVFDTLGDLKYRAHKVDRYTQSSVTDDLADDIGVISPHKEIENNAKAIKSYEELCDVIARYNELRERRVIYGGDKYPTLSEDEENEFAELTGRLNATRDGVKITWREIEGDINKLAQLLGIQIPQAAQQAEAAVGGLNNELAETGDKADNIGEQTGGAIPDTGSGQTAGATSDEVKNLNDVRDAVGQITANVKEKTQEFLNEQAAVKKVSDSEVHALGEVEKKVTAIRVALSNVNTLLNNIKKGNDISSLNDIKVTVNYPEQQDNYAQLISEIKDTIGLPKEDKDEDDLDPQQVKNIADILTRIKIHTHNTVRQIRDNLIGKLGSEFTNLKTNVYKVKLEHNDNNKNANKVAINAEDLEGVLRRVFADKPSADVSSGTADTNAKSQTDGLVAQYKRAMATIAEWQTLYQNLNNLPTTNTTTEQRKNVLDAVSGISPELAHMIGGAFEEAFKAGFKGFKSADIARYVSRIAEESLFGSVPEQVEMLQNLDVDNFDFDKLPIQEATIDALNPVFELLQQIDAVRKGATGIDLDNRDDGSVERPGKAYALDSTLKKVKGVLEKIAANTASLNGVEIQRAVEKNAVATEGVAPEVAKETSTAVTEGANNIAKVIEKKRTDENGNVGEYADNRTVVRGQKTSNSYQTTKTHMVPEFDEETEAFKGYKTTLVEIIDDFDKIRKENIKAEKDLVRAQKKVSEFLAKFQSKTGGNAQYVDGFSKLQNLEIDASNIDEAYNSMIMLQQKYAELERNFRKGQSSLNPFVNAINRSQNIGNIFGEVEDKFNGLVEKSDELTENFTKLQELTKKIQNFTKQMETDPASITPEGFTNFSQWMGDFTALKTQVDSMIRSEKVAEKETAAKNAERAREIKSLAIEYEKLGKLRAKFEGSENLETKEELKILAEQVKKRRESLELTTDEVTALREKSAEAYKTEQRLVEAAQKQKLLAEQQKAAEKVVQDASKQADREAIKQAKQQAAESKRAAKREAMFGKAGNAIGRAENLWMSAQGEDKLPENLTAQVDKLYDKMVALREKQDEVRNAKTVTKEQQEALRNQTIETNKLTNEVSELFAEYQRLSGANVDEAKTKTTTLTNESPLASYEAELKQYVRSIKGGKAQIKGFNAETKTLTYTVKTGKHEFTEYTAAVRHADNALVSVRGATKRTETFFEATARKMKELTSYMSGMAIFSRMTQEVSRGIQYIREIDLALTELKKVTDETEETYDKFLDTAAKTGARLGTTISAVTEATATFAKLGYTMTQATEMAEAAIVYKNVGDNIESTGDAADSIISTMKGFKLEATEAMAIVDRFNEVGKSIAHVV